MPNVTIQIRGRDYTISREDIIRVAHSNEPGPIKTYYVEVESKKHPPKQLIRLATGTRSPFDSANARSALTKLGFVVKAIS